MVLQVTSLAVRFSRHNWGEKDLGAKAADWAVEKPGNQFKLPGCIYIVLVKWFQLWFSSSYAKQIMPYLSFYLPLTSEKAFVAWSMPDWQKVFLT